MTLSDSVEQGIIDAFTFTTQEKKWIKRGVIITLAIGVAVLGVKYHNTAVGESFKEGFNTAAEHAAEKYWWVK